MEKPLLTEAITVIMAETLYNAEKKVEAKDKIEENKEKDDDLENKVEEAEQKLTDAVTDSFQQFKKESEEEIIACEKSIADFKVKMPQNIAEHETRSVWLEQKISDLKSMLLNYNESGQDHWKSFKIEFNLELDDIEKAVKHFTFNKNRQLVKHPYNNPTEKYGLNFLSNQ